MPAPTINPLREGIANRLAPEPCTLVIFGATGDLTHRKLIPALYNLAAEGALPPAITIVGFARRDKTTEEFRKELEASTRKFSRTPVSDELWNSFASSIVYHRSAFDDIEGYKTLAREMEEADIRRGTGGNRLYYLAVSPDQFPVILGQMRESGLNNTSDKSWSRVIVEKPFGTDLQTARELNTLVNEVFPERDTYRIDHYLGGGIGLWHHSHSTG